MSCPAPASSSLTGSRDARDYGLHRRLGNLSGRARRLVIYSVRFEVTGFARVEVPRVEIRLGRIVIFGATLRVGSLNETIEVTADNMPMVDSGSAGGRNFTLEEIDRLPKARSFNRSR